MTEVTKVIQKKIDNLNRNIKVINLKNGSISNPDEKIEPILSTDLTEVSNELTTISSTLDDDLKENIQKIVDGNAISQITDALTSELDTILAEQMEMLNAWKQEKIDELTALAQKIATDVTAALLPSIPKIPPIVEKITTMVEDIKTEVEEKILKTKVNIELAKDNAVSKVLIKSYNMVERQERLAKEISARQEKIDNKQHANQQTRQNNRENRRNERKNNRNNNNNL